MGWRAENASGEIVGGNRNVRGKYSLCETPRAVASGLGVTMRKQLIVKKLFNARGV